MTLTSFFIIIWFASAAGIVIIIWKKRFVFIQQTTMHQEDSSLKTMPLLNVRSAAVLRRRIPNLPKPFLFFGFAEKFLAKIHIGILKMENKIRGLRDRMRNRSRRVREINDKKPQRDRAYWEALKKKSKRG